MARLAVLLLLLAPVVQDEDLVKRLTSEDIAVREAATGELVQAGLKDRARVELLAAHPIPEVRERSKSALLEIDRRIRIRSFRPDPWKLTLELVEVPVEEAAPRIFEPFGVKVNLGLVNQEARKARISLSLKEATLWKALNSFRETAKVEVTNVAHGLPDIPWILSSKAGESSDIPRQGREAGEAWVHARVVSRDPGEDLEVHVEFQLPPGHLPIQAQVEPLKVLDDRGREIPIVREAPGTSSEGHQRAVGQPSKAQASSFRVKTRDCEGSQSLRLEGTLRLDYPRDFNPLVFDVRDFREPLRQKIGETWVTLEKAKPDDHGFSIGVKVQPNTEAPGSEGTYRSWVEDADGRWLGDWRMQFGLGPGLKVNTGEMQVGGDARVPEGTKVARVVIARLIGVETTSAEFKLDVALSEK